MSNLTITGKKTTHDESSGLQNSFQTGLPPGDADDNDIALNLLPTALSGLGNALGAALSGYGDASDTDANGEEAFTHDSDVTGVRFSADINGAAFDGTQDSGFLTAVGDLKIYLYYGANDNILLGRVASAAGATDPNGTIAFAAYIEETATGGKIWTTQYVALQHPDTTKVDESIDLTNKVFITTSQDVNLVIDGAPSGQSVFLMFTQSDPDTEVVGSVTRITDITIVATGKNPATVNNPDAPDTVNTSQAGTGDATFGTNNQMIVTGEGVNFSFVTGANQNYTIPNLSPTEASSAANIDFTARAENVTSAEFDVVQTQGGKKVAQVTISAFKADGTETGAAFVNSYGGDVAVSIESVTVTDTVTGAPVTAGITIDLTGIGAVISGVKAGQTIAYTTLGEHDRVLIENTASTKQFDKFDIGGFKLLQTGTETAEIGSTLFFEDDGPNTTLAGGSQGINAPAVDETTLGGTSDFSGDAPFLPGAPSNGTDGATVTPGTPTFTAAEYSGASTSLFDALSGDRIYLYSDGNSATADTIYGRVGLDDDGGADSAGAVAFTISRAFNAATGQLTGTMTQSRSLVHGDPTDDNDTVTLAALPLGTATRTDTITDSDGDSYTTAAVEGDFDATFTFVDDAPTIAADGTVPTLTVDETFLTTDAGPTSFANVFTPDFNNDGPLDTDDNDVADAGALTYALGVQGGGSDVASGLLDSATGLSVVLNKVNNGSVVGTVTGTTDVVFVITLDTDTGDVSLDQQRAVIHDPNVGPNDEANMAADRVTLTATAVDGDGDDASAPKNIGNAFVFKDDAPTTTANPTALLDDDALSGGIAGGTGDDANASNTGGTLGHDFKNDGAGSVAFLTTGAPLVGGFTYEAGANGSLLVKQGTTTVLTLTLIAGTGAYTVAQNAAIVHAAGGDENNQLFTINYRVTDRDGDTADGALFLNVDDDSPTLNFGNLIGTGTDLPQFGAWLHSPGADGLGSAGLDIAMTGFTILEPGGGTQAGSSFSFSESSPSPDGSGNYQFAGTLTGVFDASGSQTIGFTLIANANGSYVLDLAADFGSEVITSTASGTLDAGGPDPVRTLTVGTEDIVFFGVKGTTASGDIFSAIGPGAGDLTEAQVEGGGFAFLGTADTNVSTSGIGIGNNNLESQTAQAGGTIGLEVNDDSLVVNPEFSVTGFIKVYIDNSVTGYVASDNNASKVEHLYYTVFYEDGTTSGPTRVTENLGTDGGDKPEAFTILGTPEKPIDAIQITMQHGAVKIPFIEFQRFTDSLANDLQLAFTATVTDGDGDTATSAFAANLFADELNATFDYSLVGVNNDQDTFNVDLAEDDDAYQITDFQAGDLIKLIGDTGTFGITYSGGNSIVTIDEAGAGLDTVVTVIGYALDVTEVAFG